jgi:arylsulfatase A-like enzyme
LFLVADDHRFDAIHAFDNPVVQTPVLDSLAASGTSFRKAHVMAGLAGGLCAPCRAALLTGVNVFRTSAGHNLEDNLSIRTINPELAVMPETFKHSGYHTYAIGKWHNDTASFAKSFSGGAKLFFGGMSEHRKVPVFDFDPEGKYPKEKRYIGESFSTEMFSDAAICFLQEYREEAPYFLYVAFTAPHDPRTPPQPYADMYSPEQMPLPDNYMPEHPFDNGTLVNRDEEIAPWPRTPEIVREHTADYYGMISHLDAQIGRILETLAERDDANETIIVYTADHGIAIGRHGLMGKQNLYDHSIRVPFVISGPGIPAGEQSYALIYPGDIFPSLCELCDIPIPDSVEMHSLIPLWTGEQERLRDTVYAAYKDIQRSVSDGEWKLIRYTRSELTGEGIEKQQLFHIAEDPAETNDLADSPEHRDILTSLAAKLEQWQLQVGDPWGETL